MKKVIASVLALTMTAALLVGCGAKSEKSEGGEELTVKILNNKESLCLAPVHIAIINGYFDEPGAFASWGMFALLFNKILYK